MRWFFALLLFIPATAGGETGIPISYPPIQPAQYNIFPWGQCTWFISQQFFNAEFLIDKRFNRDARHWYKIAQNIGFKTTKEPVIKDGFLTIFVSNRGQYGHVAIVVGYDADVIHVWESNIVGLGVPSNRAIERDNPNIIGFILHPVQVREGI